jgi:NIPSNAP protein
MPILKVRRKAMANAQPVTCQIRYTLDLSKLSAFESYARTWMVLIERYGGIHHGYFIPRTSPDVVAVSFPGLGYDGPADVAVAMFTFPDEGNYRRYREMVAADPECQSAAALVRETGCFTRYERLFLEPVKLV